ncbi:MAG TPA: recombinase family protein [Pseudolabrys sp.]|nr:recombinase family protein [Pseudolabrys sp.]
MLGRPDRKAIRQKSGRPGSAGNAVGIHWPRRRAGLRQLGRSTRDVLNLIHELDQKGAFLRILEPAIATDGPMGKMVLTVLVIRWQIDPRRVDSPRAFLGRSQRSKCGMVRCEGAIASGVCNGASMEFVYDGKDQLRRATKKNAANDRSCQLARLARPLHRLLRRPGLAENTAWRNTRVRTGGHL